VTTTRGQRVVSIVACMLDMSGGKAQPRQVERLVLAAGYTESEVRRAFDLLHLVAVTDPHGVVYWTRRHTPEGRR
jgi:hypothetical protein